IRRGILVRFFSAVFSKALFSRYSLLLPNPSLVRKSACLGISPSRLLELDLGFPRPQFPTLSQPWYPISHPQSAIVGCDTSDRHTDYGFEAQNYCIFIT